MTTLTCLRCGHRWVQRVEHPHRCPHCFAPYRDKPRRLPLKE